MHILMTGDAVGGVWSYALDLARGLGARGCTVTLAVLGPPPSPGQRRTAAAVAALRLVETDLPLDWTAAGEDEVRRAGEALVRLAGTIGPDIVHLHTPALACAGGHRRPVCATVHSCVATWWRACGHGDLPDDLAWRRRLVAEGCRAVDMLIAPSAAFAAAVAEDYGLETPPLAVHNGRLRASPQPSTAGAIAGFALTAGRLWDAAKGADRLDRAAALMRTPVVMAGSPLAPGGAGIALHHARPLGHVDDDTLAAQLRRRPVFVSLARYEPFGLAVLEAAQAGCPLVLSRIATFEELWDDAALFVDADDPAAVAGAVDAIAADPVLARDLGRRASLRADAYSLDLCAEKMLKLFARLGRSDGGGRDAGREDAA